MKRKVLSALLAATMVSGLLVGCGSSNTSSSSKSSTGSTTTSTSSDASVTKTDLGEYTEENPYHLVFSYIEFYQQDDAARTAVQDAMNEYMIPKYHIEVELLPMQASEYAQKVQLMISGGDIKAVQGTTGHASADMLVNTYAHIQQSSRVELGKKFESGFYAKPDTPSPQAVPAAGEPTISMTALLELLKDADPEMKAKLRLALLT